VNLAGDILQRTPHVINRAGFVIHSAVHDARPDVECVMHLHTRDITAVSATAEQLLPLNQTAMIIAPHIAFHDYEGVAVDAAERARLAADLGTRRLLMLRNHGALTIGESVAEAFFLMYSLEWACGTQVRTLGMGLPIHEPAPLAIAETGALLDARTDSNRFMTDLLWPALLRKLDRCNPGYSD
jgi:ribulose-5-phosphate 4-epimerase/fuculose-1-phosphate aldolase